MTDSRQLALEALRKCAIQLEMIIGKVHEERCALMDAHVAIAALEADLAAKVEPYGYWHSVADPDECEFHLASDISGDCACCIPLYAAPQQVEAPGWKLAPIDPTPAMSAAGLCVSEAEHDPAGVYRAMLDAAPRSDA